MELTETGPDGGWAAAECTLPTVERPLRAAEFDELFAAAVHGIDRAGPTRLRLDLRRNGPLAASAARLMLAETQCCSFFTFALTATGDRLTLDVAVPGSHAGVLDALAARAAAVLGPAAAEAAAAVAAPSGASPSGQAQPGETPAGTAPPAAGQ